VAAIREGLTASATERLLWGNVGAVFELLACFSEQLKACATVGKGVPVRLGARLGGAMQGGEKGGEFFRVEPVLRAHAAA
jgi:hypothetical protein